MKLVTHKSKNLLYRILPANNCTVDFRTSYAIATQTSADTNTNILYKCQYRKDGTYLREVFDSAFITSTGKITRTFTTPADLDYNTIMFGLNGTATDTLVAFLIKLKPSTTYTFTCNFTNITQGSISWKDMMLVEGSTAGDYEPYSYNLLDKNQFLGSNSNYINNGDGSITTTGIAFSFQRLFMDFDSDESSSISKEDSIAYLTYGHKLLINDNGNSTGTNWSNAAGYVWELNSTSANAGGSYSGNGEIFTNNKLPLADIRRSYFYMKNNGGEVVTCKPTLYDLTLMYGAGKEPTTVDQFYKDYPMLKVAPLGFIDIPGLELKDKGIKRLRYKTWDNNLNLIDKSNFRSSDVGSGVTFTNNGDGSWTVNGTATSQNYFLLITEWMQLNTSHKYLLSGCPKEGSSDLFLYVDHGGSLFDYDTGNGSIGTPTKNSGTITIAVSNNTTVNNAIFKPQLYDLTEIYGASKEPTTVEQFYKDHPLAKTSPLGFSDLGIIPSNSGYIIEEFSNLSEELLKENVEIDNVNYHIPDKTNILLNKVEGKTNKIVQLTDKSKYDGTSTNRGITFTNNGNGTITINGTNDGTDYSDHPITNSNYLTNDWLKGRKYLFYFSDRTDLNYYAVIGGSTSKMEYTELGNTSTGRSPLWKILSPTDNSIGGNSWYILRVKQNAICTNELASPQVFDLTAMYGFGNEPTTAEQFKKDYPQFFDEKLDGIWNVKTSGISTTGKNLFDVNNAANNNGRSSYSVSNDEIIVTQNSKDNWSSANFPIKNSGELVGKTISISCFAKSDSINKPSIRVQWMTSGGLAVGSIAAISLPSTSTTFIELAASGTVPEKPATADTLRFMFYSNSDGDLSGSTDSIFSCTYKDIQLEISDSATAYEPYTENKIDLLSTQTLNGINGVNDYIEVIDKGNGLYDLKKTKNIDSVDLGTLDWAADGANFSSSSISSVIKTPTNDSVGNYVCQKYVNCAISKSFVDGDFGVNSSGYLYFRNSAYTTAAAFKTAVNGVILYYQLKTPVTTIIATNLTYNQVSAIRTNGGLLLVNDNNNQKYVQPNVTITSNYQYKS